VDPRKESDTTGSTILNLRNLEKPGAYILLQLAWMTRSGKIIILEKVVRTVPYGYLGVLFPIYLSQLGFDAFGIGLVITLTTVTSAFYTLVASLVADRIGRRRTLIFFALTDCAAAAVLFLSASPWAPVVAGVAGNMSIGAGEAGPYLSLEQAILPRTSDARRRTLSFSVYNLFGYGALASGALLAGLPQFSGTGWAVYRPLFLGYLVSGLLGVGLYSILSRDVEQENSAETARRALSKASRPIVLKLSSLFALDSFGGGFIGLSIIPYYFYLRYQLQLGSLGLLVAATQVITAASFLVSERIARRIGLLRTMVFTHIPSNVLLAAIPFAPSVAAAVALLLGRQSLSQMDVAPRQSYVMSSVPESDRAAAAGLTNSSRSFSQSASPFIAGYTIENLWAGSPFVFAGTLKIIYDVALYRSLRKIRPPEEDTGQA
jgi:MFS family permease